MPLFSVGRGGALTVTRDGEPAAPLPHPGIGARPDRAATRVAGGRCSSVAHGRRRDSRSHPMGGGRHEGILDTSVVIGLALLEEASLPDIPLITVIVRAHASLHAHTTL